MKNQISFLYLNRQNTIIELAARIANKNGIIEALTVRQTTGHLVNC